MKYIITAGGTGGHINPAIFLCEELISKDNDVLFVASKNKIDYDILKSVNFDVKHFYLKGFSRSKSPINIIKSMFNVLALLFVMVKTTILIFRYKPDYVIGFGGFITFPILKVANMMNVKTAIHEQNSFPGLANRKAGKFVDKVFYTFDSSVKFFPSNKLIYASNPCIDIARKYQTDLYEDYVVFIGGSLGAERINELAFEFAAKYNVKTKLIAGARYAQNHKSNDIVEVIDYIENPYELLAKSKLVVARGGASTLLELVALKANALIVPSPNVVNDHQTVNAEELAKKKLVTCFPENIVNVQNIYEQYTNKNKVTYEFGFSSLDVIVKELNE